MDHVPHRVLVGLHQLGDHWNSVAADRGPAASSPVEGALLVLDRRRPLIEAYRHRFGRMPKVAASFDRLPDPAEHPTFRIDPEQS